MAQVKGTVINAWRNFLKERYGEDKVAKAVQSLDTNDRVQLLSPILDSSWHSMELQQVMNRLTRALATAADKDLAKDLGRYMADYVHTKVYSAMLGGDVNKNKTSDWFNDVLYKDLRKCVTERKESTSRVTFYYLEGKPTAGQCQTLSTFLARHVEIRGRKNVRCVHPKCLTKGADCCEFVVEWE
jgi:hypothetical protein